MTNKNIVSLDDSGSENSGLVEIESSRAVQEVQASLIIAQKFPRNEDVSISKIMKACSRVKLAEVGIYSYAKGGSDISGPSIRLAEAMAQSWGNIDFGWRELSRKGNTSEIQAYCWDKETNTRQELTFNVKHVRSTKKGNFPITSERDIYENNANNAARRMRNCILAVMPGDVVESAVEACERTIATQVTEESINALINAFFKYNINIAMIEARIQRSLSAMQPANIVDLRKVYNSMRDGMSGAGDWFDLRLADKKAVVEEKTQLDEFKEGQETKNQVGVSNKQQELMPSSTGQVSSKAVSELPHVTSGSTEKVKNEPFPGCNICGGSGEAESTDPQSGELIFVACPECVK